MSGRSCHRKPVKGGVVKELEILSHEFGVSAQSRGGGSTLKTKDFKNSQM